MSDARQRLPAEERFADELKALAAVDTAPRPPGWALSPRAVRAFVCGTAGKAFGGAASASGKGKGRRKMAAGPVIERKFYGDDALVERAVIALAGNRGLLLVGEPGTAKSMLSELLAAAICGSSQLTIQGTAATTEDQIRYTWNYALLLAEGPSPKALVPSPILQGMRSGALVRFEEITRCPPEVQDTLVSVLSEQILMIPELGEAAGVVGAQAGFNIIATANIRDRGVHEMSAALKRRFNFETVPPIPDLKQEIELVRRESQRLLEDAAVDMAVPAPVVELLVTTFRDLRDGVTEEGIQVERPTTVLSTAEAVSVCLAAGLDAHYFGDGAIAAQHLARNLVGAVFKDQEDDLAKWKHYVAKVVRQRAEAVSAGSGDPAIDWPGLYAARRQFPAG